MAREEIARDTVELAGGRAADALFEVFAQKISSGVLKDGDTLPPEREIVETYGVSRTVAREAVQALANRGLVEARPRFRPIVRRPSYETALDAMGAVVAHLMRGVEGVQNLFEARIFVEVGLVRSAARTADAAGLAQLRSALDANRAAIGDSVEFYRTDNAFHGVLYAMTGNPVFEAAHKAFGDWLSPQWTRMQSEPDKNAINYEAHAAIFDAIIMRDGDRAEAELRAHLEYAWTLVRDTFE